MSKGIMVIMKMKGLQGLTLDHLPHPIPQGMVITILLTVSTVREILFLGHEAQPGKDPILTGVEGALWYMKNLRVLQCTHLQVGVIHQEFMLQPDLKMRLMKAGITATQIIHPGPIVDDITAGGECCSVCFLLPGFMRT